MDRPEDRLEDKQGAVLIRTTFGEVAAAGYFPSLSLKDLVEDLDWRAAAGVEGGPFCYIHAEDRLMPF
jgi:hypothetical protein